MISKRAQNIPPFIVMDILERAKELEGTGEKVIHLEIGEPDFDTPECIKEAASSALKEGKTQYTHSLGLFELRQTIAEHYENKYQVDLSPDQILVTSGTSPAMFIAFSVLLDLKDEVILPNPGYSCYPNLISFIDGVPISVNVYEEDGFGYRPQEIQKRLSSRTKAIIINSPSNPTGNLLDPKVIEEISRIDCPIISDEIYHGMVYEGKEHSVLEFTNNAFVINGFSKLYAMTGWRLGYVIAPREFIRPMQKIQQNFFISANNFVQWAGIAALKEARDEVKKMISLYNKRRKYIISKLKSLGFGITIDPVGAFYVLANAKRFSTNSYKLAVDILEKAKVAITPGIDFGNNAEGYLRFSYANSLENLKEAMARLEKYLETET